MHGFSTRPGGASLLDAERVLNLGHTGWDTRSNVQVNRAMFLSALGAEEMKLITLRQMHSDLIHLLDEAPAESAQSVRSPVPSRSFGSAGRGDALHRIRRGGQGDAAITRVQGVLLAIQTADCVAVLLVDPQQRVVAAVHAGWRGTLRRIVAKTLGQMQMAYATRPQDVLAVLGPRIGRCCYEVGPEVAQAYASQFAHAREWFDGPFDQLSTGQEPTPLKWLTMAPPGHDPPPPRVRLDLTAANRWQLLDAGLEPSNILSSDLCTACRTDLFFSHRRERGRTGRMMSVIGIRPAKDTE